MQLDMVANIEVDKVADMVADKKKIAIDIDINSETLIHPRIRIATTRRAKFFSTLGTRFVRLIDGGRFSAISTGISKMR